MPRVAVALGSNLGDRQACIVSAIDRLSALLSNLRVSGIYETVPVGVAGAASLFLNAVVTGECKGTADGLLAELLRIEREHGRERPHAGASRTLDLDLIFFGDERVETAALTVPHPRFRERRFVLEPLAEVAPDWRDPVTGLTVRELLARLADASDR